MGDRSNDPSAESLAAAFHEYGESITSDGPVVRAMQDIMFNARLRDQQEPKAERAAGELLSGLKDPSTVLALMLRGAIATPTVRSMVALRGEVPNGEGVQLLRIAELQEKLAERAAGGVDEATACRLDDYLSGEFDIRIGKQAAHAALTAALSPRADSAGGA